MRLFGLDALSLSLAMLAVGALLVGLYLRKQPLRHELVPSLALWLEVLGQESPGQRRLARLRAPLSLLLALAICALLLGALGDPRPAYQASDQLLVIDRGISMSAREGGGSRLQAAQREAHAWVDALRPGERAQVLSYAAHASVHSPLSGERATLHAAIDRIEASDAGSQPSSAARLVGALRQTMHEPALVVFSDGASDPSVLAANAFVRVGQSARNVGITRFSARGYPLDGAHAEAQVTVTNFGPAAERVTLRVAATDVRLREQVFELAAGASSTRTLPELPGRALSLVASITLAAGPDPLARDDSAYAQCEGSRAPRVLLVSDGDRYLEAALLVDTQLVVERAAAYEDGHDLVIFDRVLPAREPPIPALYLGPPGQGGAFPLARGALRARPYFDRVQSTPLLTGLALRDVNIARALDVSPLPTDRTLAASADGTPLLVEGRRAAPFLALTFALSESDLGLRAAFPLLVLRAVDQLVGGSRAPVEPHLAGQPFQVALPHPLRAASLVDPDGHSEPLASDESTLRLVRERAGRYTLRGEGFEAPIVIAAQAGPIAPRGTTHVPRAARVPLLWPWLALAAALLLALDWLVSLGLTRALHSALRRRWTA